jgi:hypothetical protein
MSRKTDEATIARLVGVAASGIGFQFAAAIGALIKKKLIDARDVTDWMAAFTQTACCPQHTADALRQITAVICETASTFPAADDVASIDDKIAVAYGAAMYQNLAIVCALAQSGVIDPLKVAAWAEMFKGALPEMPTNQRLGIVEGLAGFAEMISLVAKMPEGAGHS